MTHDDAIRAGANCKSCWLYLRNEGGPVGAEINAGATAMVVGEAPGRDEVVVGRPFVGDSGQELLRALNVFGYRRGDISLTNTLLCRPPGNDLEKLLYAWKKENSRRRKEKLPILPSPADCCKPRLMKELHATQGNIVLLGKAAIQSVTGSDASLFELRGDPITGYLDPEEFGLDELTVGPEGKAVKILPTVHPAFVLRKKMWLRAFRTDVGRAMRWFTGNLRWKDPQIIIRPSVRDLETFLFDKRHRFLAHDVETGGPGGIKWLAKKPTMARLYCIGFGTPEQVMVVPFFSKSQRIPTDLNIKGVHYPEGDYEAIYDVLRRFYSDRRVLKVGHNSTVYDRIVIETQLGITPRPQVDTLVMHRGVESELPHDLYYVGSTNTDVTAWKAEKSGTEAKTDEELHIYNATDVAVTARVEAPLDMALQLRDQWEVVKKDHKVVAICAGMATIGVLVDRTRRDEIDKQLLGDIYKYRNICREVMQNETMNPGSTDQIKDILFEKWGLPPVRLSETTNEPSTDDDTLRYFRIHGNLTKRQLRFIEALRRYRLAVKLRGTNVVKLRMYNEKLPDDVLWEDLDETEDDRKARRNRDEDKLGILLPDGRIHPSWNQLTTSGRMNCSDPNMQNWRRWLRDLIIPEPYCPYCKEPHVFVGADMDQLELRGGAGIWGLQKYLAVFEEGRDPHQETAFAVFGSAAVETYARAVAWAESASKEVGKKISPKEHPDWQRMRDFAKRFYYACQYGALDKTVHEQITSVEDDAGNLIYADVTPHLTSERRANLLSANPEMERAWTRAVEGYRKDGYRREVIWGRRRDFLNGEELNEIINFDIQPAGAAIVHDATFDILQEIPFQKWCPKTGLVIQGHDALDFEVPLSKAEWVKVLVTRCMTRTYPGIPVKFTSEAKIGINNNPKKGPVGRMSWMYC